MDLMMSEEFSFTVSFRINSTESASALEDVIEYVETHDIKEARNALLPIHLLKAEQCIENFTSPYSEYKNGDCLISMAANTYDTCVTNMEISFNKSALSGEITIEGQDHNADDLCASIVLLLIAAGINNIAAHGSSPGWSARWFSNISGELHFDFEHDQ